MAKDHRRLDAQLVQEEVLLDDPGFLREVVERAVQQILEAEMTEHVGAAPYERVEGRTGHRNGYKPRAVRTRVGTLNLLVPQDREGTLSTRLFSRYQRNEKALVLALMEMHVEGVSTREGLSQSRGVLEAGECLGSRAQRRVADRQTLHLDMEELRERRGSGEGKKTTGVMLMER